MIPANAHPAIRGAVALLALAALATEAQPLYRIIGPDGRVTFTDRPPVTGGAAPVTPGRATSAAEAGPALPAELRQVAQRYPVTLYGGANCAPCVSARNLLVNRGVPFTERTVNSNEDIDALQRLSGDSGLPFATIGSQQLKGFSDLEWTQYLDAAGYPKTSQLPPSYRQPPATPLVAVQRADAPAAAAPVPAPPGPPAAAAPAPANPAGIRF